MVPGMDIQSGRITDMGATGDEVPELRLQER